MLDTTMDAKIDWQGKVFNVSRAVRPFMFFYGFDWYELLS